MDQANSIKERESYHKVRFWPLRRAAGEETAYLGDAFYGGK
jgi:hypothetical protein